jgi:uncharacterized membrane protein
VTRALRLPLDKAGIGIVLSLAFVCRWLLSGHNSYWLDELISVVAYGIDNRTAAEAVDQLARRSIHPPLYQLILYYWMRAFGDGEVATRFLSNLYVTGAGLFLYLTVKEAMGRRRALMAAILFSLMHHPFYYAMETRSYAQTLMLTTLSSLALLRFMRVLASSTGWKPALRSGACALLVASNTGLLLTHYFNVFFLVAQGVFMLGWVAVRERAAWRSRPTAALSGLLRAATPLLVPLVFLLILWGPVIARSYRTRSRGGQYQVEGSVTDPFTAFAQQALGPNFLTHDTLKAWSIALLAVCGAALVLFFGEQAVAAVRGGISRRVGRRVLGFYALVIALGPFFVSCAMFALSGHERYSNRYFIFTAPALAVLVVIAIERAVVLADRLFRRRRASRSYLAYSALATLVVTAVLVLPGTFAAATRPKADWRGIAGLIASITNGDPDHKYVVYETGFGRPRLDYYLERAGAKVRSRASITPADDRKFSKSKLAKHSKQIARYDYLVLTFTHLKDSHFKKLVAKLDTLYDVHSRIFGDDGRGIIVYRVRRDPG